MTQAEFNESVQATNENIAACEAIIGQPLTDGEKTAILKMVYKVKQQLRDLSFNQWKEARRV